MRHTAMLWAVALALLLATTAPATIFLYEGFEGSAPGWKTVGQVNGQSYSLWHLETYRSYTGSRSAAYNTGSPSYDYDVGTSWGMLVSPWINLSSASNVYVHFQSWLETENAPEEFDVAFLTVNVAGFGWGIVPPDIQSFPQGQWNHLMAPLPWLAGLPAVRFGFLFDSVDGEFNDYEGWYIDDVLVTDGETPPVPEPSTLLLLSTGLLGAGAVLRRRVRG